jgi:hypothetical protein
MASFGMFLAPDSTHEPSRMAVLPQGRSKSS